METHRLGLSIRRCRIRVELLSRCLIILVMCGRFTGYMLPLCGPQLSRRSGGFVVSASASWSPSRSYSTTSTSYFSWLSQSQFKNSPGQIPSIKIPHQSYSSSSNTSISATSTTTPSSPLSSNPSSSHASLHFSPKTPVLGAVGSKLDGVYSTLDVCVLKGGQNNQNSAVCVIVQAPTPDQFSFLDEKFDQQQNHHHHRLTSDSYSYDVDESIFLEEIEFGKIKEQSNQARLNKFMGGRMALRRAFLHLGVPMRVMSQGTEQQGKVSSHQHEGKEIHNHHNYNNNNNINNNNNNNNNHGVSAILRDDFGAPKLPSFLSGSISHKDYYCVGMAAIDGYGRVGVDLEHVNNKASRMLQRRILTSHEQSSLGRIPGVTVDEEVLLRFSFKEAIYKAIHSYLKRSVDFSEVEVNPIVVEGLESGGGAEIRFLLKTGESFNYTASWQRYKDKYWLTCIYVWPRK